MRDRIVFSTNHARTSGYTHGNRERKEEEGEREEGGEEKEEVEEGGRRGK